LDLLNDDGDGVIEMCLLDEAEKRNRGGSANKSGCCLAILLIGSALAIAGWGAGYLV